MKNLSRLMELIDSIGNLNSTQIRKYADLQLVHIQVLRYLSRCNRYSDTPSAVTQYLGFTKGTISQSIKVLENSGYIEKKPDKQDKRVTHLSLTASAKKLLKDLSNSNHWKTAALALPSEQIDQMVLWMESLLRSYQQANGFRSFGECRTCKHLQSINSKTYCGLTKEPLVHSDTLKICFEHENM